MEYWGRGLAEKCLANEKYRLHVLSKENARHVCFA